MGVHIFSILETGVAMSLKVLRTPLAIYRESRRMTWKQLAKQLETTVYLVRKLALMGVIPTLAERQEISRKTGGLVQPAMWDKVVAHMATNGTQSLQGGEAQQLGPGKSGRQRYVTKFSAREKGRAISLILFLDQETQLALYSKALVKTKTELVRQALDDLFVKLKERHGTATSAAGTLAQLAEETGTTPVNVVGDAGAPLDCVALSKQSKYPEFFTPELLMTAKTQRDQRGGRWPLQPPDWAALIEPLPPLDKYPRMEEYDRLTALMDNMEMPTGYVPAAGIPTLPQVESDEEAGTAVYDNEPLDEMAPMPGTAEERASAMEVLSGVSPADLKAFEADMASRARARDTHKGGG
jgi:hypothetical protein